MNMLKLIVLISTSFLSVAVMSQPLVIGGDAAGRQRSDFQDQRQSLIDSFRNSRDRGTIIGGDDARNLKRDNTSGDFEGGTHRNQNDFTDRNDILAPTNENQVHIDVFEQTRTKIDPKQLPYEKIEVPDTTKKQTAPMRLYFDQIHFESDDVSEVTLKDGTVIKTEELQDFAKEVIMKKLNEQK